MQTHCPCWIREYLCLDLQELASVYWLCGQLAYCSKTEARAIVWNKRIQNRKRSSCLTTKSGSCTADVVTECTSATFAALQMEKKNALQIEVMHKTLIRVPV